MQQVPFYFIKLLFRLHYKEREVRISLEFRLPVFKRICVLLFIHILTGFPQFLIVNDINIWTLIPLFLNSSRILFKTLNNKFLIHLSIRLNQQNTFHNHMLRVQFFYHKENPIHNRMLFTIMTEW